MTTRSSDRGPVVAVLPRNGPRDRNQHDGRDYTCTAVYSVAIVSAMPCTIRSVASVAGSMCAVRWSII